MSIRRGDRGSASIEAAIAVPAFGLFVGLIIFGGRTAIAQQSVESAASDAARSASILRTNAEATAAAQIGRASGRERVGLYVWISGVAGALKTKKTHNIGQEISTNIRS